MLHWGYIVNLLIKKWKTVKNVDHCLVGKTMMGKD